MVFREINVWLPALSRKLSSEQHHAPERLFREMMAVMVKSAVKIHCISLMSFICINDCALLKYGNLFSLASSFLGIFKIILEIALRGETIIQGDAVNL